MAPSSAGLVAGLTATALATIGFLGYQAAASAPSGPAGAAAGAAPPERLREKPRGPLDPPHASGSGTRVVYDRSERRIWLLAGGRKVLRTFEVMPSTVHPPPGTYTVTSRSGQVTGSDGVAIEHVVRFANVGDVVIGFSAAVNGALTKPDLSKKTGGIRMMRADGDSMWRFATIDTKVVVVR
ncbi:L,D-transpeptidase [Streptomyces yaizuensis]|uniref:L,D-transpeptidase n=1 Tax=Streptomyces yaizuensis TaxID=2989713 RepID=A0ABQ5P4Y8_9ACTN|nr:L,D-transpeptidase [Streptomyces sp. YSPA8]GLF97615.1 L,D-transpeptidase [Streptomyces sp. YSPA8]